MIIRKADSETENFTLPTEQLISDMMKYNEEMINAGVMLSGDGLLPSSRGARVKFSGGKPKVIDGPFAETKELIAGFSIIQVKSLEEALEWVKRWPPLDGHGEVEIEIRQIVEAEDFGEAFTEALQHQEALLRQRAAENA
jgi:hypothetical protein